jgi:membrane-associated PAP2 superfamily phosphatase
MTKINGQRIIFVLAFYFWARNPDWRWLCWLVVLGVLGCAFSGGLTSLLALGLVARKPA